MLQSVLTNDREGLNNIMKKEIVIKNLNKVREISPLVHNITNYVVMNNTANALLALGASPVMAHAAEEMEDFVKIDSALVINIGTLSEYWISSMKSAMAAAIREKKPIVFDPVGVGASSFRTETVKALIEIAVPSIIRGNASEIMSMRNEAVKTKGVDSFAASEEAVDSAKQLASELGCVVCVSGETDYITDGKKLYTVKNGSKLMAKVTGMGCTASALTGAFAAVAIDPMDAAFSAMVVMGIAGEIAAEKAEGPGTLQLHFLDVLYNLSDKDIEERFKG
jgi:hydroxyethylthiazole kinase